MVAPGIGSQSPAFQSRTRPCGLAISSGVSCASGTATTSVHTPRCRAAKVLKARPIVAKASKSVRVCHGGAIAGLNELTKGCMSVVFRSCFSYHVAVGSTTSEKSVVLVIRKSSDSNRSSFGICQPVWGTDLHLLLSGGLLRLGLVDPRRSRRAGRGGRLVDEPFGVGGGRRVKDAGPFGVDGLGAPVVHVGRDVQPQTGVPVLVVVPAEEGLTVHASRFDRGEAGGEVGPVLQRLELGLGVWVVIAHVRSGVGLGDPEVGEQQGDRLGRHRAAPVGVQGQLVAADVLLGTGLADQRLGPVSYTHLRAHETDSCLVCRLLLDKKKKETA